MYCSKSSLGVITPENVMLLVTALKSFMETPLMQEFMSGSGRLSMTCSFRVILGFGQTEEQIAKLKDWLKRLRCNGSTISLGQLSKMVLLLLRHQMDQASSRNLPCPVLSNRVLSWWKSLINASKGQQKLDEHAIRKKTMLACVSIRLSSIVFCFMVTDFPAK